MTFGEHIRESDDIGIAVAIAFCIVEYLQQSGIIKAISMDDKKELMSDLADDLIKWLADEWDKTNI
ncbi:hypothetical protein [Diplocloster modestus]|uniref:Uncharacterized protein n=1 Tax=Diplocloster modestus TaxID=2850322 RepID=A0ABS6K117_9FIRM|nr:hypothetical protein [Diplocloster modestus]MBU9724413.1 hypothetical protein [Diplocloster modestus]